MQLKKENPSPCYIFEESKLRNNLTLIRDISHDAGVEIILALKAFALWKTFPIFHEYINHTTASSLNEARVSAEEFGGRCHTYSPAYEDGTFRKLLGYSEHITFNSLSQYAHFMPMIERWNKQGKPHVSAGLRINPEYSEIETDLYNPCVPGSRLGILAEQLPDKLPVGIDGFHFHCLCENDSTSLVKVLDSVEKKFGKWLDGLKWLNMGGGHLMTRKGYHITLLVKTLKEFGKRHPNLKFILEPGSAFLWGTGFLTANVVDLVENKGTKTAILNVSFACHMPDCLEMPYQPLIRGAEILKCELDPNDNNVYRMGGNSCLSGDYIGYWKFDHALKVGEQVIFEDMIHYTTVKTSMFNGISHPSIALLHTNGSFQVLKKFGYNDYKNRMC